MAASVKNQARLRAFLTKVRTRNGLNVSEFAELIGPKSMVTAFLRKEKQLGSHSIRIIARRLSLDPELVSALLDAEAPLATFPPPESITLPLEKETVVLADVFIDVEAVTKMMNVVSAAGKPMPLSTLLQLIH